MRLILARHGTSTYAASARYAGARDIPLSADGEREAAALGRHLADLSLSAIFTSDLVRASATADAISAFHAMPAAREPALRECAMGAWEGLTYAEAVARDPALMTDWLRDPVACAPPGGERVADVLARVLPLFARARGEHAPDGTVIWVTHAGVIRSLLCHLLGMDPRRHWQFRCDYGSLTHLYVDASPLWHTGAPDAPPAVIVTALNDTTYLRADLQSGGSVSR